MKKFIFLAFSYLFCLVSAETDHHPHFKTLSPKQINEISPEYWYEQAQQTLKNKLQENISPEKGPEKTIIKAKNIIFFIGDGMDLATVAATRMYLGGEEKLLSFEKFPDFALTKTYCVDGKVADSACTSTAYLSGAKANVGTIGVDAHVNRFDCASLRVKENHVDNIADWAQAAGKSTGIVTTTRITHASPAGAYSHTANRDWEASMPPVECYGIGDIAQQLTHGETGRNFNVILGGGRRMFRNTTFIDEEGQKGSRTDGRDLIKEWTELQKQLNRSAKYVWKRSDLLTLDIQNTDHVLGLFEADHCQYNLETLAKKATEEPSLMEMTETAIKLVSKNNNGYFLFIEGGRIDHAHHGSLMKLSLDETAEFSKAIKRAVEMVNLNETLIVVSSDHAHTTMYAGYAPRGSNILGLVGNSNQDGLPMPIMSYQNGPGYDNAYNKDGSRKDLSNEDMEDIQFQFPTTVKLSSATHAGSDVGVYAIGPHSHLFTGVIEQNSLPLMMAFSAKIGPYKENSAAALFFSPILVLVLSVFTVINHF